MSTEIHEYVSKEDIGPLINLLESETGIKSVNQKDSQGQTPLHLASSQGSIEIIRLLCYYGADLDIQNDNGELPVDLAASQQVQLYLEACMDVKNRSFEIKVNDWIYQLPNRFDKFVSKYSNLRARCSMLERLSPLQASQTFPQLELELLETEKY